MNENTDFNHFCRNKNGKGRKLKVGVNYFGHSVQITSLTYENADCLRIFCCELKLPDDNVLSVRILLKVDIR